MLEFKFHFTETRRSELVLHTQVLQVWNYGNLLILKMFNCVSRPSWSFPFNGVNFTLDVIIESLIFRQRCQFASIGSRYQNQSLRLQSCCTRFSKFSFSTSRNKLSRPTNLLLIVLEVSRIVKISNKFFIKLRWNWLDDVRLKFFPIDTFPN